MPIKLRINKTKPLDFWFIWEISCVTFNDTINVHKYEKGVFGNSKLNINCIINILKAKSNFTLFMYLPFGGIGE